MLSVRMGCTIVYVGLVSDLKIPNATYYFREGSDYENLFVGLVIHIFHLAACKFLG